MLLWHSVTYTIYSRNTRHSATFSMLYQHMPLSLEKKVKCYVDLYAELYVDMELHCDPADKTLL